VGGNARRKISTKAILKWKMRVDEHPCTFHMGVDTPRGIYVALCFMWHYVAPIRLRLLS